MITQQRKAKAEQKQYGSKFFQKINGSEDIARNVFYINKHQGNPQLNFLTSA